MGEQWSPKMLPPNMAPATNGMLVPISRAMGSAMTAIMAIVPMEVPVAKEMSTAMRKVSAGSIAGLRNRWNRADR